MTVYVVHSYSEFFDLDGASSGGSSAVAAVFSTPELAQEFVDRREAAESSSCSRSSRTYYDFESAVIDELA